ncbi:recombinase family protein [Ferruginivarius sediminum]|nr:recombinase family protein [Ferruginivarius sediminum]
MRAAIYARYSSDNQREASIADQVDTCRRVIARTGWQEIGTYEDRAISGASASRPGYQQLLADAEAGKFDVVVCEALDRLGRRLADVAALHDQLSYLGIKVHAANAGEITPMHIGMLGTMAQMYLADLRDKTRRGQRGRVQAGRIPAGRAYGYDIVESDDGDGGARQINPAEAAVVRRIFEAYAAGHSPRRIAHDLNAEGVPGPRGGRWRDTTIRGQVDRGTGILNNDLYVGRVVWNRCSYVKNPRTGRRVARPNPPDQHEVVQVPALRIVDDALWNRVKERQNALHFTVQRDDSGNALNRAHRRRFLLSGLLVCGHCGGRYTIIGVDRYGCATRRSQGTCQNNRTITRQEIERRVLDGLKDRLLAPDMVETFMQAYQDELKHAQCAADADRERLEAERAEIQGKIDNILQAIEANPEARTLASRLNELETRLAQIDGELERMPEPEAVELHPNAAQAYRRKAEDLQSALEDRNRPVRAALASDVRRLG